MFLRRPLTASCVFVLLAAAPALGQTAEVPSGIENARYRWGPWGVSPRIEVTNVGIDSNVFNSSDQPQRDFTATVSPGAESWLRFGLAQLRLSTSVDWTYFREAAQQRWFGVTEEGRFELLFNRLNPHISGLYSTTRQRPNLEIDVRVRQKQQRLGAGTALRLGARTTIDAEAAHSIVDFSDPSYGSEEIASALNRETREAGLLTRVDLTPLTSVFVRAAVQQDRFEHSSLRDSNSVLLTPGVQMAPRALLAGRAAVGFRQFDVLDPLVPDYAGVVASAELAYIAGETTRFSVALERDVDYSVEEQEPYSVVSNAGLTVTQVIGFDWYVAGRAGRAWLDYRSLPAALEVGRRDAITTVGVGVARRVGIDLRVGFDVDRVSRRSPRVGRDYDGYRLGGTITYGSN